MGRGPWTANRCPILLAALEAATPRRRDAFPAVRPPRRCTGSHGISSGSLSSGAGRRREHGSDLQKTHGPGFEAILHLNRIDLDHLRQGATLVVPESPVSLAAIAPFPKQLWEDASMPGRILIVSRRIQAFAAYEAGALVRWGGVSTGRRETPTPEGLFATNWRSKLRKSSDNPAWLLPWYFNFINSSGVSFHQFDLPGYPASHACVRLLEADAKWIYEWAESWVLADEGRRIEVTWHTRAGVWRVRIRQAWAVDTFARRSERDNDHARGNRASVGTPPRDDPRARADSTAKKSAARRLIGGRWSVALLHLPEQIIQRQIGHHSHPNGQRGLVGKETAASDWPARTSRPCPRRDAEEEEHPGHLLLVVGEVSDVPVSGPTRDVLQRPPRDAASATMRSVSRDR